MAGGARLLRVGAADGSGAARRHGVCEGGAGGDESTERADSRRGRRLARHRRAHPASADVQEGQTEVRRSEELPPHCL